MHTRPALLLALALVLPACASLPLGPTASKAAGLFSCVAEDDRLRIAIEDPERAREDVARIVSDLRKLDPDAVRDAADILARQLACIEEAR